MNKRMFNLKFISFFALCFTLNSCSKSGGPNTVKDKQGNIYRTITIGTQTWMAEDLKTTIFNNGDPIPKIITSGNWQTLDYGAYCDYNNSPQPGYGKLYNWYVIKDPRGIAPKGWHIAKRSDWETLIETLGGYEKAGGRLKKQDTLQWISPHEISNNTSGFDGLPGGCRDLNGFHGKGYDADFWCSTLTPSGANTILLLGFDTKVAQLNSAYLANWGFYVRCIKN